jgi:hypothetical protein
VRRPRPAGRKQSGTGGGGVAETGEDAATTHARWRRRAAKRSRRAWRARATCAVHGPIGRRTRGVGIVASGPVIVGHPGTILLRRSATRNRQRARRHRPRPRRRRAATRVGPPAGPCRAGIRQEIRLPADRGAHRALAMSTRHRILGRSAGPGAAGATPDARRYAISARLARRSRCRRRRSPATGRGRSQAPRRLSIAMLDNRFRKSI